jgi:hypothetical protein
VETVDVVALQQVKLRKEGDEIVHLPLFGSKGVCNGASFWGAKRFVDGLNGGMDRRMTVRAR